MSQTVNAADTNAMNFPGTERTDDYADTEPVQTWGTEYEWYAVIPRPDTGTVAVIHYVNDSGEWEYADVRTEHITGLGK